MNLKHTKQHLGVPKRSLDRWASLSPAEKQEEFSQLIRSPYWNFLPEDIQTRIRGLLSH